MTVIRMIEVFVQVHFDPPFLNHCAVLSISPGKLTAINQHVFFLRLFKVHSENLTKSNTLFNSEPLF